MYEPVDSPLPLPHPRSLLEVARILGRIRSGTLATTGGTTVDDQADGSPVMSGPWRQGADGVTFTQEACGTIEGNLLICEGTGTDPQGVEATAGVVDTVDAYRFRAGSKCSRMSGPDTLALVEERARRALGLWQHQAIAANFWDTELKGAARFASPNPVATAVKVIDGLAGIEEAMAGVSDVPTVDFECGPGQMAVIHASSRAVAIMSRLNLVTEIGGLLKTANGSVVVSGPGYTGDGPVGQTAGGASTSWIYASGMPDVYLSPVFVNRTVDRQDNDMTVWASRAGLVTVGSCCVAAIKIDLTDRT